MCDNHNVIVWIAKTSISESENRSRRIAGQWACLTSTMNRKRGKNPAGKRRCDLKLMWIGRSLRRVKDENHRYILNFSTTNHQHLTYFHHHNHHHDHYHHHNHSHNHNHHHDHHQVISIMLIRITTQDTSNPWKVTHYSYVFSSLQVLFFLSSHLRPSKTVGCWQFSSVLDMTLGNSAKIQVWHAWDDQMFTNIVIARHHLSSP